MKTSWGEFHSGVRMLQHCASHGEIYKAGWKESMWGITAARCIRASLAHSGETEGANCSQLISATRAPDKQKVGIAANVPLTVGWGAVPDTLPMSQNSIPEINPQGDSDHVIVSAWSAVITWHSGLRMCIFWSLTLHGARRKVVICRIIPKISSQ